MALEKYTAIDLFSGCGGLSEGLEEAGFSVVAAVELNAEAAKTYQENHPSTRVIINDIRKVSSSSIMSLLDSNNHRLDLLAGCPPCQGFSSLRTRNGKYSVEDDRNNLLFEFLRLIVDLKPRAVLLENVPALSRDHRFESFLSKMSQLGYIGEHRIVNVADYGVPQSRKRLMYVAGLEQKIPFPPQTNLYKTVRDAIGTLPSPGGSGDSLHDWPSFHNKKVRDLIEAIPKNGGSRESLPENLRLACHRRTSGFKDVYGRMAWEAQSPTITGGCIKPSKGRFIHPERNGAITLREAALLQGFPERYRFIGTNKDHIALMIGNAFPPPAAKHAGKVIIEKLKEVDHAGTA